MNARTSRTVVAAALLLGIAVGPAGPALAADLTPATAAAATGQAAPDAEALRAAIAGLPRTDATAALVRVAGTAGTWRGSSGVHDLESGLPADPGGRFRAGSVTKVFTAAVVLQLAGEGKLDLNLPVRHYLPELIPAAYKKVTVRQLLNHTSGIPSVGSGGDTLDEWYAHRFDLHDAADTVREATSQRPDFAPGTRQHYDNIGYTVAGLLIEKVTGRTYESEVSRRILDPLGLKDTGFPGIDPTIRGPHNHGYQVFAGADGTSELRDVTVWGGDGRLGGG